MSIVRLLLLISAFCSFSWAQAEELNSPVLIEQSFEPSTTAPRTLAETRQQTLSFVFISHDIIPGQEMTVQFSPDISPLLHITRDGSGNYDLKFDQGFPADLRKVSLIEQQDDYFELQVTGWNTALYSYSLVKAQILSETGKSIQVQFSNPNFALIKIQSDKDLSQWLSKTNEVHSLTEWYGSVFRELSIKENQKIELTVSCQRNINGTIFSEPVLQVPGTPYFSQMAAALDSEITQWLQNEAIAKDDIWFSMDLTIFEQADDLEVPVYTIHGLNLQGTSIK